MTRRLRLLKLTVLCLVMLGPVSAAAEELVTVEAIEVRGVRGGARIYVENALELASGKSLSREDLAARLEAARSRLLALGIYEKVEFALERGKARGSFRVLATLVRTSATYFGVDAIVRRAPKSVNERATRTALFGGTRDLLDMGAHVDVEVSRDTFSHRDENAENAWNDDRIHASARWPDLAGTPAELGIVGVHAQQPWANSGRFPVGRYENRGDTNFQLGLAVIGWRFALMQASAAIGRGKITSGGKSKVDYDAGFSRSDREMGFRKGGWFSFLALEAAYSDKSHLALVEPGVVARISYERGYGSGDTATIEPPKLTSSVLDTFLVAERHALTPAGVVTWSWPRTAVKGDSTDRRARRQKDLGLTYEWVGTEALVVGFEHAYVEDDTGDKHSGALSGRRTQLVLKWGTSSFLASLRFVYGWEGLNLKEQHLSDRSRVGEP